MSESKKCRVEGVEITGEDGGIVVSADPRVRNIVKNYLGKVEGRVKTFVEATTEDPDQCRARKDMVSRLIWSESEYLLDHIRELTE